MKITYKCGGGFITEIWENGKMIKYSEKYNKQPLESYEKRSEDKGLKEVKVE